MSSMEAEEARLWALRVEKANLQAEHLINELDARLDSILELVTEVKRAREEEKPEPAGLVV